MNKSFKSNSITFNLENAVKYIKLMEKTDQNKVYGNIINNK